MLTSPARPLILSFGAAIALFDLVTLLPGNPDFTSTRGLLIGAAIQALIVWRLLHRSPIAWFLALIGSSLYVVSFVFLGGPYETTFTATAVLTLMQIALLLTPPVMACVFGKDDGAVSHWKGG